MGKMSELSLDIEELLLEGNKPATVSQMLNVPIKLVEAVEDQLMQLNNPRSRGPDYGEDE